MSRTSNRRSSNRAKRGTYTEFDADVSVEDYTLANLKKLASDLKVPDRSEMKTKQALYTGIKEFLEEEEERKANNAMEFAATGGYNLKEMSTKQLKELAGEANLDIPNRGSAKNHDDWYNLVNNWYKEGKDKEPRAHAPSTLTVFDPSYPADAYKKANLYKMGEALGLPVTKGMNLETLYETVKEGSAKSARQREKDMAERKKRMSANRTGSGATKTGYRKMNMTELRNAAKDAHLVGYSKKNRADIIDMLEEWEKSKATRRSQLRLSERFLEEEEEREKSGKRPSLRSSGEFTGLYASRPLAEYNFMLDDAFAAVAAEWAEEEPVLAKGKPKPAPAKAHTPTPPSSPSPSPPKNKGKKPTRSPSPGPSTRKSPPSKPKAQTAKKPPAEVKRKPITDEVREEVIDTMNVDPDVVDTVIDLYYPPPGTRYTSLAQAVIDDMQEHFDDVINDASNTLGVYHPSGKDVFNYYILTAPEVEPVFSDYESFEDSIDTMPFEEMKEVLDAFTSRVPLFSSNVTPDKMRDVLRSLAGGILIPLSNYADYRADEAEPESEEEEEEYEEDVPEPDIGILKFTSK